MKTFFAQLTEKRTIHTPADRMSLNESNNMVYVYNGDKLVAMVDVSTIMFAHFSEKKE